MLIQQGRTLAPDINTAIEQIRAKHGEGRLSLRACPIQPVNGMTWFDFMIDKEEPMSEIILKCPWCGETVDRDESIIKLSNGDRPHYKCSDKMLEEWSELANIAELLWNDELDEAQELAFKFYRERR